MFNILLSNEIRTRTEWTSIVLEKIKISPQLGMQIVNLKYLLKKYKELNPNITSLKIDQRFFVKSVGDQFVIAWANRDNVTEILQADRTDEIRKIYIATNDIVEYNASLPIYNQWQWDKTKTHLENLLWWAELERNFVGFWYVISVDSNNSPATHWYPTQRGNFGEALIYGNRAKITLNNFDYFHIVWEKNNAMEFPAKKNDKRIDAYISFPWEWSTPITDRNSSRDKEELCEWIPMALYTLLFKNISNTSETKLPKNIVTYKWNTPLKIQEISKADYDKLTSVSQDVLYITKDKGGEPLLPHVEDPIDDDTGDDELSGD